MEPIIRNHLPFARAPRIGEEDAMKGVWTKLLSLSLGIFPASLALAQEAHWRPVEIGAPVAVQAPVADPRPAATVSLGRPVPLGATTNLPTERAGVVDRQIAPASYSACTIAPPRPLDPPPASADAGGGELGRPVVRAQAPDSGPTLNPPRPVAPGIPATPDERYNCGVVNDPPAGAGHSPFAAVPAAVGGVGEYCGSWCRFRSDHCFDNMISPVSNPFLFEDPRSLTEIRPIFMLQGTPGSNPIYRGGDVVFFGTQARLAVTERLSFTLNKLGLIWNEPHEHVDSFDDHVGFAELWLGPKFTFLRNEQCGRVAAAGLIFQIPTGSGKVFQDTGTLSLVPYVSFAQSFWQTSCGTFNFLGTTGYAFSTDNERSDYYFLSLHLDYDVGNLHHIYPLMELNYFYYASGGNQLPINFEGRDLFNFGATGISGRNNVDLALGARYKFSEAIQTGLAVEFPINGQHDLLDYRVTFDLIFRY
jgi:hypothetical protein